MVGTTLIEPGSITAALMNFITDNGTNRLRLDDNGLLLETMDGRPIMRFDPSGLRGFNPAGTETFAFDPATGQLKAVDGVFSGKVTGSEITGSTVQSDDAPNSGTKLDDDGLRQYGLEPGSQTLYVTSIKDGGPGPGLYLEDLYGNQIGRITGNPHPSYRAMNITGPRSSSVGSPSVITLNEGQMILYSGRWSDDMDAGMQIEMSDEGVSITNTAGGGLYVYPDGTATLMGAPVTAGPWSNLPRLNGWANVSGRAPARYRIEGRNLRLSGAVVGGSNGHIGTLPVGSRPTYFADVGATKPNSQDIARITVESTGRIVNNTLTGASGTYISLDGIVIPLD